MRLCLISRDAALYDFLAEIVGSNLCVCDPVGTPIESEVYIVDFRPEFGLPDGVLQKNARHLFLVDAEDLAVFGSLVHQSAVSILLKPVDRSAFAAYYEATRKQWEPEAIRAERDLLLQYSLEASLKLQESDQERANFAARALHDLRAPLTALQGNCGLLLARELGALTTQQDELLQCMAKSSRRLARLASGLFDLSVNGRIQRSLQLEAVNIEGCIKQALHEIADSIHAKQLHVVTRIHPPRMPMLLEPQQIEQLFVNLLENACKFSPKSAEIEITGGPVYWDRGGFGAPDPGEPATCYQIDVKDSGPGIDASLLESIFEQFTSYLPASDRTGGGLGLAICKSVVSAHGGRIWATSSERGAQFSVVLPFEPKNCLGRPGPMSEQANPPRAVAV